ncbi:hypothetical protein C0J52_02890 [Blattella germanica]|nr:hypothetical protein C0J52_02890 [Blattella germanica]
MNVSWLVFIGFCSYGRIDDVTFCRGSGDGIHINSAIGPYSKDLFIYGEISFSQNYSNQRSDVMMPCVPQCLEKWTGSQNMAIVSTSLSQQ